MIYLLHGADTDKSRAKMHELSDSLKKKKPDAAYFKMDAEHWNEVELEEYCGGQGLFENKFIIVLDHLMDDEEIAPVLLEQIEVIAASSNVFIVLEGKLDKDSLKKFEKHAEKVQEFEETAAQKMATARSKERFNVFSLAEAMGKRDRKNLWVLYRRALLEDISPEEIHGTLFWQAKSIALARQAKSAKEAGMKDFPFSRAKAYANNFSEQESNELLNKLIHISHDSRRGLSDISLSLEELTLTV
jgi:DNA polymerase III delta subunit